jgi:hypothetical protein
MITTIIFISLLLSDPNTADPNSMKKLQNFVSGWLLPGETIGKTFSFEGWVIPPATMTVYKWVQKMSDGTYFIIQSESPTYLKVTGTACRAVNYKDFSDRIAKHWIGDPNYKPPVEPNEPTDPCEPNLVNIFKTITDPNMRIIIEGLIK